MEIYIKSGTVLIPFTSSEFLEALEVADGGANIFLRTKLAGMEIPVIGEYETLALAKVALSNIATQLKAAIDGGNVIVIIEDF